MDWASWYKGPVLQTAFPPERLSIISSVSLMVAISNVPNLALRALLYDKSQPHTVSQHSGCVRGGNQADSHCTCFQLKPARRGKSNTSVTEKKALPPPRGLKVTVPPPWPSSPAAKVRGAVCISGECVGFHEPSK